MRRTFRRNSVGFRVRKLLPNNRGCPAQSLRHEENLLTPENPRRPATKKRRGSRCNAHQSAKSFGFSPQSRKPIVKTALSYLDRARAYVKKMPDAISGADGSGATFAVACKLVELDCRRITHGRCCLEYNQRCQPQWSERELRHKLDDAFRRANPRHMDFVPRASYSKPKVRIDPAIAVENFLKGFRCALFSACC